MPIGQTFATSAAHFTCRASPRLRGSGLILGLLTAPLLAVPQVVKAAPPEAAPPFEGPVLERQVLIAEVLERNRTLKGIEAAWQAVAATVPQVEALADPMVGYEFAPLSIFDEEAFYGHTIRVEQRFPFFGARRFAAEAARARTREAKASLAVARADLALEASNLFDDYFVSFRGLEINRRHIALVEGFRQSAEAQYTVGRASQQDPLQAEAELAELLHEQSIFVSLREQTRARLNGLLHRDPSLPFPPPPESLAVDLQHPAKSEALYALALERRAELEQSAARLEEGRAETKMAKRSYYPELGVMGSYTSMWQGAHRFMAGVTINLPLALGRRRGAVAEAQARTRQAAESLAATSDGVRAEVEVARQLVLETLHQLELFRSRLLPAARDRVAAARAGFETGKNSFLGLIDAERNLRSVELRWEKNQAELQRRRAHLNRTVGLLPGQDLPAAEAHHKETLPATIPEKGATP